MGKFRPLPDRFWEKVEKRGHHWFFTGSQTKDGYGQIQDGNGKLRGAHVVSYEMHFGPLPPGTEVHHGCEIRNCVNPDDLRAVTHQENMLSSDTLAARNAERVLCKYGHPFDARNTYYTRKGSRSCRRCRNRRVHENQRLRYQVDPEFRARRRATQKRYRDRQKLARTQIGKGG
ncbi:MAG TPA: HNH endonuclease signature motif containing protein [Blastocatellia bacterium]